MSDELIHLIYYGGSPEKRDKERKRKRDRYAEDEAHRLRKIEAAKARYHATKKAKNDPAKRGFNRPRPWLLPDGTITTLISSGEAANICGVSKRTLAIYEKKGIIPVNLIVDDHGRRWYPKPFVIWLSTLLADQTNKREPHWKLKRRVERAWQEARAHLPVVLEEPKP